MKERLKRKGIYLATIAAMIAMTGGYVMATTISTLTAPPAQGGGYTGTGTPPAGVSTSRVLMAQAAASAGQTSNSIGSPAALTAGTSSVTDTVNVNAIAAAGDFTETVTVAFTGGTVPASTEFEVSIYITGSTGAPQVVFVETSSSLASPAVDSVNFVYDMGSGSGSITITSVSDLITQCGSVGTCS
jgi:hypothetical protein